MIYEDRPYQAKALEALRSALRTKKNVLLTAPCSAGKTYLFGRIIQWLRENDRKCLVLLDREVLAAQTAKKLKEYLGENIGVACASLKKKNLSQAVTVASRQTMAPMMKNGHSDASFNLCVPDEVHLCNFKRGQYADIITKLRENYTEMRLLGCTATPYRLGSGKIYGPGKIFDQVDYKITAKELIDSGYIVPLRWKVRKSEFLAQLDQVGKTSTGELNDLQQGEILEQPTFIAGVYDVWNQYCKGKKTAIFALSIKHAEAIAIIFRSFGIKTWIIHSKQRIYDVRKAIKEFVNETGVIINVGILTIGADIPSMEAIILARRTMSTALHFQIVGRLQRLFPGKDYGLVIDLVGNRAIHGDNSDNPLSVILDESEPPERPKKICPMCEEAVSLPCMVCPSCGFHFPVIKESDDLPADIKDHGDPGELMDAIPLQELPADEIHYSVARIKGKECVRASFYMAGRRFAQRWLFIDYWFGKKSVQ
ncbi:MAG: DEAD/DEAH box helicase family protein, partial [Syntrophobacteraceae bacterium]